MEFNPTFKEIQDAYKSNQKVTTDTNESGAYNNYTKVTSVFGEVTQQVDGIFGGHQFKSTDGKVIANTEDGVRGLNIPSTLFVTKDGVTLVFY